MPTSVGTAFQFDPSQDQSSYVSPYTQAQVNTANMDATQLFRASLNGYQAPPNPQLLMDTLRLGSGQGTALLPAYNSGAPQLRAYLTASPAGAQPDAAQLPSSSDITQALQGSVQQGTWTFDPKSYKATSDYLVAQSNDQSIKQLGEMPLANVGYFQNVITDTDPNRIKRWQAFLRNHPASGLDSKQAVTGVWDQGWTQALQSYLIARFMPDALFKNDTGAVQFLDTIGVNPQDIVNQNRLNPDFQKQIFMQWLGTQDASRQWDASQEYMKSYGDDKVPDAVKSMKTGVLGTIADTLASFNPFGIPLGSHVISPIENLFQPTAWIHRPQDFFEDYRSLRSQQMLQSFTPQEQANLQGVAQQISDSQGFLGAINAWDHFRNRLIYGLFYNFSHMPDVLTGHIGNPFDDHSAFGQMVSNNIDNPLGAVPGTVGDYFRNNPNSPLATSLNMVTNLVDDPLTWTGVGGAAKGILKVGIRADEAYRSVRGLEGMGRTSSFFSPWVLSPKDQFGFGVLQKAMQKIGGLHPMVERMLSNQADIDAAKAFNRKVDAAEKMAKQRADQKAALEFFDLRPTTQEALGSTDLQVQLAQKGLDQIDPETIKAMADTRANTDTLLSNDLNQKESDWVNDQLSKKGYLVYEPERFNPEDINVDQEFRRPYENYLNAQVMDPDHKGQFISMPEREVRESRVDPKARPNTAEVSQLRDFREAYFPNAHPFTEQGMFPAELAALRQSYSTYQKLAEEARVIARAEWKMAEEARRTKWEKDGARLRAQLNNAAIAARGIESHGIHPALADFDAWFHQAVSDYADRVVSRETAPLAPPEHIAGKTPEEEALRLREERDPSYTPGVRDKQIIPLTPEEQAVVYPEKAQRDRRLQDGVYIGKPTAGYETSVFNTMGMDPGIDGIKAFVRNLFEDPAKLAEVAKLKGKVLIGDHAVGEPGLAHAIAALADEVGLTKDSVKRAPVTVVMAIGPKGFEDNTKEMIAAHASLLPQGSTIVLYNSKAYLDMVKEAAPGHHVVEITPNWELSPKDIQPITRLDRGDLNFLRPDHPAPLSWKDTTYPSTLHALVADLRPMHKDQILRMDFDQLKSYVKVNKLDPFSAPNAQKIMEAHFKPPSPAARKAARDKAEKQNRRQPPFASDILKGTYGIPIQLGDTKLSALLAQIREALVTEDKEFGAHLVKSHAAVRVRAPLRKGPVDRLLVSGDRNWTNYEAILEAIRQHNPKEVIEGEARGADSLARKAAEELGIPVRKFPADWKQHGNRAGPIRNNQMLDEGNPDLVLAFHDDLANSKGTKHMVQSAQRKGYEVHHYTQKGLQKKYPGVSTLSRDAVRKQALAAVHRRNRAAGKEAMDKVMGLNPVAIHYIHGVDYTGHPLQLEEATKGAQVIPYKVETTTLRALRTEAKARGISMREWDLLPDWAKERAERLKIRRQQVVQEWQTQRQQYIEAWRENAGALERARRMQMLPPEVPILERKKIPKRQYVPSTRRRVVALDSMERVTSPYLDHAREIAAIATLPETTANDLALLLDVFDTPKQWAKLQDIIDAKDGNEKLQLLDEHFREKLDGIPGRKWHEIQMNYKYLTPAHVRRISSGRFQKLMANGALANLGSAVRFDKPRQQIQMMSTLGRIYGMDSAEMKKFIGDTARATNVEARRDIHFNFNQRLKEHIDKTRPNGMGWEDLQARLWEGRIKRVPDERVINGFAIDPNISRMARELNVVERSTGNPVTDDILHRLKVERSNIDIEFMTNITGIARATLGPIEHPDELDMNKAVEFAKNQLGNHGVSLADEYESRKRILDEEMNNLLKGKPEDRPTPINVDQLQYMGYFPMTAYEALLYQSPRMMRVERLQKAVHMDEVNNLWKNLVLLRPATSFRIALGDEVSRFVVELMLNGHSHLAAAYLKDVVKYGIGGLVSGAAKKLGREAPQWAKLPADLPDELGMNVQQAFNLNPSSQNIVYTPSNRYYAKALHYLMTNSWASNPMITHWAKIHGRDNDVMHHLFKAEEHHRAEEWSLAHEELGKAHAKMVARENKPALDALEAQLNKYKKDAERVGKRDKVLSRPALAPVLKQLPEGGADVKEIKALLRSGDPDNYGDAIKLMERNGYDDAMQMWSHQVGQAKIREKVPTMALESVRRELILAHEAEATAFLERYISMPPVRLGQQFIDPFTQETREATEQDVELGRKIQSLRSANNLHLSERADPYVEESNKRAQYHFDQFTDISKQIQDARDAIAAGTGTKDAFRKIAKNWKIDEKGRRLDKVTGAPAKGKRRVFVVAPEVNPAVVGRDPMGWIFDEAAAMREAAGYGRGAIHYADLPAADVEKMQNLVENILNAPEVVQKQLLGRANLRQFRLTQFARERLAEMPAIETRLRSAIRETGWGEFTPREWAQPVTLEQQALARARWHHDQWRTYAGPKGSGEVALRRKQSWAQGTHNYYKEALRHPELMDMVRNVERGADGRPAIDFTKLHRMSVREAALESTALPRIVTPMMTGHAASTLVGGNLEQIFNWYHENITQRMVNSSRQLGAMRLQGLYAERMRRVRFHDGEWDPGWDEARLQQSAWESAYQWVEHNTYQGQRTLMASALRNVFPFWGATANMGRFWSRALSSKLGPVSLEMPFLRAMKGIEDLQQQGGVQIPTGLGHFLAAMHLSQGDEVYVNPLHALFFTTDGMGGFAPGLGPIWTYGLQMAASHDPELVDQLSAVPLIGKYYSQHITDTGINPVLGWTGGVLGGAYERATGNPLDIPLLTPSSDIEKQRIMNEVQAEAAQALANNQDPTKVVSEEDATKRTGLANIIQGTLGSLFPVSPTVANSTHREILKAYTAWDQAHTPEARQAVKDNFPNLRPLLDYIDPATPSQDKELIGLGKDRNGQLTGTQWVTAYATAKYKHGPLVFTPSLQDFNIQYHNGDVSLLSPQDYLTNVEKNFQFNQGALAYGQIRGQMDAYFAANGVASNSAVATQYRKNVYYPQMLALQAADPLWYQQFVDRPGKDPLSLYETTRPLRSLMAWEAIPLVDGLDSTKTNYWRQAYKDIQDAASAIRQIADEGGTSAQQQQVFEGLQQRLISYANQNPEFGQELNAFHFGKIEDIVDLENAA